MKVIDLLNKIANKEDVPEKIKYNDNIYELKHSVNHLYNYIDDNCDYLEDDWYLTNILNDEIEIIEDMPNYIFKHYPYKEDKKIAKIGKLNQVSDTKQHLNNYILRNKINEIIDRLNGDSDE